MCPRVVYLPVVCPPVVCPPVDCPPVVCLCGCCRPASGHTVRGVSEKGPAVNLGPHQIQN